MCKRLIDSNINDMVIACFVSPADLNKGSPIDYKSGSACSTPTKDTLKSYERNYMGGPVLPPRSSMNNPPVHHHYSAPLNFRKGLAGRVTWKCATIVVSMLCVLFFIALVVITSEYCEPPTDSSAD